VGNPLEQSVAQLKGVGAQTALRLEKMGIRRIQDLLFHLPVRYQDRTRIHPIASLTGGMTALVCGQVQYTELLQRSRNSLICRIADDSGSIALRFFHFNAHQHNQLKPGVWISCFAEVRFGFAELEMVHPDYCILSHPDAVKPESQLTPVYPLTEGISQQLLRKTIKQALSLCPDHLTDWLPEALLRHYRYPDLATALHTLHTPDANVPIAGLERGDLPAFKRLALEELLAHHLKLRHSKQQAKTEQAAIFSGDDRHTRHFISRLPFQLTGAQQRVMAEIAADCGKAQPMLRLVQGDVGSGKTLVAAYAALLALLAGYQTAIMAPTELLAEQHYRNFSIWFADFAVNLVYLTGQAKGKARREVLQALVDGSAGLVIGTHALFQEHVHFHKLGLVIIDEQHRFGVHQRLALREKAQHGLKPHQLVMTATPIPRTLAMLHYADLDVSVIDELPPGRTPVITSVIPAERRDEVISRINSWVAKGRQAYWVCTLIEESDTLQCEAAEHTAALLHEALPGIRVGLIHGRMKATDKEAAMQAFKHQQTDLLVATTVIEVGVDVPNAGLMIIENPERLGLSQLHQLRGRVGRGVGDSYCLLIYQAPLSDTAKQRLGILRDSHDGFVIAEKDLQLRGPGEVMGTRQTGALQFKVADLARDADLIGAMDDISGQFFGDIADTTLHALTARWLGMGGAYTDV